MSGIDERPQRVVAKDKDFSNIFNDEMQAWERHVAERFLHQPNIFRTETEQQYFSRELATAIREYGELYGICLTNVFHVEELKFKRQRVEGIMDAMQRRIDHLRWVTGRMGRWERFKRWIRNVW